MLYGILTVFGQIKWVITPNFCGLLRKAELYEPTKMGTIFRKYSVLCFKNVSDQKVSWLSREIFY